MEQLVQNGAEQIRGHPPDFCGNPEHKAELNNCLVEIHTPRAGRLVFLIILVVFWCKRQQ
jgi:hypothetical protein